MIWCIPNRILKSNVFFISILVLSVIPSIWYVNYLAFSRFLSFAPYFLIGWYLRDTDVITRISGLKAWNKLAVIVAAMLSCLCVTRIPIGILWGFEPLHLGIYKIIIFKVAAWLIAIINSIALFIIAPKTFSIGEGRHTLAYYLLHTLILFPVLYYVARLLPKNYFVTAAVLLLTLAVLAELRRINWIKRLLALKPMEMLNKLRRIETKP